MTSLSFHSSSLEFITSNALRKSSIHNLKCFFSKRELVLGNMIYIFICYIFFYVGKAKSLERNSKRKDLMMCKLNIWTVDLARQGKKIIGHLKLRATEYFKKIITAS